jgi:hypothetical protein
MKRMMLVGLGLLLLSVTLADARGRGRGTPNLCVQLTPFVDTLELDVQWFSHVDAVLTGQIPGEPVAYRMEGGGPAPYNYSEEVWPLSVTLNNEGNNPIYFANHSICRLVAVMNSSLVGPWAADCIGNGFGAFYGWGQTMPIPCDSVGSSESSASQALDAQSSSSGSLLLGGQQK